MKEAPDIPTLVSEYIRSIPQRSGKDWRIWPSDLGVALEDGPCQVAFWLKCRNEPQRPAKPGEYLMLDMGNHVHERIAEMVREAVKGTGWKVSATELTVEEQVNGETIRGRYDILLENIDGRYHIIDVKTKRGGAFRYLNEAKPGDVLQVQWYMAQEGAESGSVLYVDREGQNFMREFPVERDDAAPRAAVETLQALRDNPMPPPPVKLRLHRNYNKGADSFKVSMPWQIEWCDMEGCACMKSLPVKSVPKGIAGKLIPIKDTENAYEVKLTEDGNVLRGIIIRMLEDEFPNETFVLSKELV